MLIEGTKTLAAPRAAVWRALNDPAFLQMVIPGCRSVQVLPDSLQVALTAAVGPIRTGFEMQLVKEQVVDEQSYVLTGRGSAGAAGAASGSVRVDLADLHGGTLLKYVAQTELTGRIAQLGSRLIDSAARRYSEEFFGNVGRALGTSSPAAVSPDSGQPALLRTTPHLVQADLAQALSALAWKVLAACFAGTFAGALAVGLVAR
jgi:carbon monoxide dehydrogenase subunit G